MKPIHNSPKIVFVTPEFFPKNAGVANATLRFAKALLSKGYRVEVVTNKSKNDDKFEVYEGINIHRINWPNMPTIVLKVSAYLVMSFRKIMKIRSLRADIVFGETIIDGGVASALAGKFCNCISVVQGHGTDVDKLNYSGYERVLNWLSLNHNDIILTTNNDFKIKLEKYTKKEVLILPNVIDGPKVGMYRGKCRRDLHFDEKSFHVLFVGRLIEIKGIRYLIQAMKRLKDCKLHILGGGELKSELESFVTANNLNQRIFFYGRFPNEKVFEFMRACDVLVFPSIREGLSMTILESASVGLPIVATSVGGTLDVIRDEVNGLLIEKESYKAIEKAVTKLKTDKDLRERLSKNMMKTCNELFSEDKVVEKFEKIVKMRGGKE
ncbi:Trehalose synthase [ANME-1 cluster archaeon GoMg3.2]|nr:Trehalose synthase [ANME-1 cluster archaeon GoMg3.2]